MVAGRINALWSSFDFDLTKQAKEDGKESRFEEGVPADPTKNMEPEDAAKWKAQTEKNKDNFKSASESSR
jgi:hypothetical protein